MKNKYKLILMVICLIITSSLLMSNNAADYYVFIVNTDRVTSDDMLSINNYSKTLNNRVIMIDAKNYKTASDLYGSLKYTYSSTKNNLKGIQIFGSKNDVPTFSIGYKIDMGDKIDEAYPDFASDFFYSNFQSDERYLSSRCGINDMMHNNGMVSFQPEWIVSRLPLAEGQFTQFMNKYFDYEKQLKETPQVPYVVFSNPIFAHTPIIDDMAYFFREKLDHEYGFVKSDGYRLYGNKQGFYKASEPLMGDFDPINVEKENKSGIMNMVINCHGESDKFIKTVFSADYQASAKSSTFMDRSDINRILGNNYYTLTTWSCFCAKNLDTENIIYDVLRGKCVNAMACTTLISNNGTNSLANLQDSKDNNFYYFYYELFNSLKNGVSRSQSFHQAQKLYASEVLKHQNMELAQYHILNLLGYHYLGVI